MSQIKIYKTEITPDRNARVDDIAQYLALCPISYHTDKLQYQKIELDLSIKLPIPQEDRFKLGNYVCINQDGKDWYFFLLSANWTSKKAVRINLSLDTVNTFANDLVFNDKTTIIREHRNRFSPRSSNLSMVRIIDPIKEGIVSEKRTYDMPVSIIDTKGGDRDWYLVYRTSNKLSPEDRANPISCSLISNKDFSVPLETFEEGVYLEPDDLSQSVNKYYITYQDSPNFHFNKAASQFKSKVPSKGGATAPIATAGSFTYVKDTWATVETFQKDVHSWTLTQKNVIGFKLSVIPSEQDRIQVECLFGGAERTLPNQASVGTPGFFTVPNMDFENTITQLRYSIDEDIDLVADISKLKSIYFYIKAERVNPVKSIELIDKSDSRIVKIIRLPYCPVSFTTKQENYFDFGGAWYYENMELKLRNTSYEFENAEVGRVAFPEMKVAKDIDVNAHRDIKWESKLYHSDFYTYKVVYDTFSKDIPLENLIMGPRAFSDSYVPELSVSFKPTNTVNSKMAFQFNAVSPITWNWEADYDKFLLASRNNEETIFNNDYLNYIRNGYNYDKKQHDLSIKQQIVNSLIQAASAAASLGLGRYVSGGSAGRIAAQNIIENTEMELEDLWSNDANFTQPDFYDKNLSLNQQLSSQLRGYRQNRAIPFAQSISTATGLVNNLFGILFNQANFRNQMDSKLAQLSAQSTTTAGTDDSDLLKYYNHNKLQIIKYQTITLQKQALYNLFFYTGYAHPAQEIPALDTRYWFNYIQCEPVFENEATTPYWEFLNDVKERYKKGITIYHAHNGIYDFAQDKENWETFLVK